MKKNIILAIAVMMLLVMIGGCWPWWYGPGGPHGHGGHGGHGGYDRGGHYDSYGGHQSYHRGHR